ncbi:Pvc16 family protein [Saccharopolyspora shandongensis]|uniref:Pvc16 family protein n=1 Tax=Saccharopolyspora shandongensis TaxID=418495 RepID=UPI0034345DB4
MLSSAGHVDWRRQLPPTFAARTLVSARLTEISSPQTTVSLFLFDVQKNRGPRDNAPLVKRADGACLSRRPPLWVDCTCLITVWPAGAGAVKAAEEHRLPGPLNLHCRPAPTSPNDGSHECLLRSILPGDLRSPALDLVFVQAARQEKTAVVKPTNWVASPIHIGTAPKVLSWS